MEIKDEPENPFNLVRMMIDNKLVLDWYIAVSYTHLDVYKRQTSIITYIHVNVEIDL